MTREPYPALPKFVQWVSQVGGDIAAAELLGCCRSYIFLLRTGKRKPGRLLEVTIEEAAGIRRIEWQPKARVRDAQQIGRLIAKRSVG